MADCVASNTPTIPRLTNGAPRAGAPPAPTVADLSPRNRARLARIYLDGIATMSTTSSGDEPLRGSHVIARLAEIDAVALREREGVPR